MNRPAALGALLHGLVDYAGLFPPASLSMGDAVARFAAYAAGPERAMLGRFVLPAAKLDDCARALRDLDPALLPTAAAPWRLSALASVGDAAAITAFDARDGERLRVDTIEAKAETPEAIGALADSFGEQFRTYVEIPVRDDPAALIRAIGAAGLRAKVRTGGVTADAFPAPAEVLRFLAACVRERVPFKATAGLHHPLRGEYALTYAPEAPRGTMFGFLNIFLTAALLDAGVAPDAAAPLLEERDGASLRVDGSGIAWRGLRLTTAQLAQTRALIADSFGSCSFEEPVQDLTSLRLL